MHQTKTLLAAILDVDIYLNADQVFIASVKLLHVDQVFILGGEKLFSFAECRDDSRYFLHFLKRCMAVNKAGKLNDLLGTAVQIQVIEQEIIGMSSLAGQDWFFPVPELKDLLRESRLSDSRGVAFHILANISS
jgi:hypothetical protein